MNSPTEQAPEAVRAAAATSRQVYIRNIVSCGQRMWLRMYLSGSPFGRRRWWSRGNGNSKHLPIHLEVHVSGKVLEAEVPVPAGGEVDCTFAVELPPARRGWRVARCRAVIDGQPLDACGVVAAPPAGVGGLAVIILPRSMTESGAACLPGRLADPAIGDKLRRLHQSGHWLCYLASVPAGDTSATELALAISAINWPSGQIFLLPTDATGEDTTLIQAVDRLR